jgi:RNA polymerase sigma-70 factor, ECF subfamily
MQSDERRLVELMVAYQSGDLSAFEQLYAALVEDLRRYFLKVQRDRAAAHDLVQDTFLEMHRSRRTYTPPLPVRPWAFGIARNVLARSRRAAWNTNESVITATVSPAPSAEALDIENALARLPASTRNPWLLHHVFGLSFHSIAESLGITVMAAKLRSSRATKALRTALSVKPRRNEDE